LERIQRATVFIIQARSVDNDLAIQCVGSGTIISRSGIILTNAHSTLQSAACPGDTLIIALATRLDEPPVLKYRAEIIQADTGLDIALLKITREFDGRLLTQDTLALPFVELADSNAARLDQTITVVGYSGIGDDPVASTRGTIIGFVSEPRGSTAAWIKTSATIPGTMSGGGAYNQEGRLVGIPTTAPLASQGVNCVPIQDTNQDKVVNNRDICIPVGGFINALRPSNFVRPLLRAASLGYSIDNLTAPISALVPENKPSFKRLFFAPSVNEAGMPTTIIRSLPAGSNSLFLFFDYENMSPETIYELRVTTDGIPNPAFSLAPVRWSGGERGIWYIGSSGQPWPNGTYEFTLFADGVAAPPARLTIGAAPDAGPTFTDLVFGLLDLRNNPLGNGYVLPSGNVASARFIFRNMQNGTNWTSIWYLNGVEVPNSRSSNVWNEGESGSTTTSIRSEVGLPPGSYRLELYIENRLATTADFIIAGVQQGAFPAIFFKTRFVTAATPTEAANAVGLSSFPNTINNLYALFDWQQIAPSTLWTLRWSIDGQPFFDQTLPWKAGLNGQNYLMRLSGPGSIPDGTYKLDLLLNNVQFASIQAQVGIGQLPLDRFAQAGGIQMRGQILDSNTRQGISGVTFILISKEFSVAEFTKEWNQRQIYAMGVTDRNGRFEIDRPLEILAPYSVIINAQGYLPISADGIEIKPDGPNPLDLTIYLTRD
jgi:hypothetical protein